MKALALSCLTISTLIGLSMVTTAVNAKQYYKWVDSNGSTHYTTTPPPQHAKKSGTVNTYGWANSAPTPPRSNSEKETSQQSSSSADQEQKTAPEMQQQNTNLENPPASKPPVNQSEL